MKRPALQAKFKSKSDLERIVPEKTADSADLKALSQMERGEGRGLYYRLYNLLYNLHKSLCPETLLFGRKSIAKPGGNLYNEFC